ncbi:MAG: PorP/SprF family type IX secretion system membrane protein [Verrucomicrobia bacterium]|nr:PorP/SprF family type IX secretion system membrane protein [Cytophagales bacterium]
MKKSLPIVICMCLFLQGAFAQDIPFYVHFFNNFYPQNPAFAGNAGYPVFFFTHHRQQIGGIEDAPQHNSLVFNAPLGNSRTSWGGSVYSFSRSLLKTNGAYLSLAHRVDMGLNHFFQMGISGGMASFGVNSTNLEAEDIESLVIANRFNNQISPDGQFGFLYQIGHLQMSAALPKLFRSVTTIAQDDVKEIYPMRNRLYTVSYQYYASQDWMVQPFVIYRDFEYSKGIEVSGSVTYRDHFWAGASYRQNYGSAFMFGMKKDKISVGFAYKFSTANDFNISNPAYELQIGLHLGKKHKGKFPKQVAIIDEVPEIAKQTITEKPVADTKKIAENIRTIRQGESNNPLEMQAVNYFVVVGSFANKQYAQAFTYKMRRENFDAQMGFNSNNQKYYVYVMKSEDKEEASQELEKARNQAGIADTWLLKVIE